jgi:hypothetical protein
MCIQYYFAPKFDFMAEVGLSGTHLLEKPGFKPEMKIQVMHQPDNYY